MGEIKILDCTLRDGGYLNDWEFGHNVICSIFERLVSTGVDVIEVGFLNDSRPFDGNRTIMPDTVSVEKIYGKMNKGNAMVVGMIDYGTCSIENIQPCEESYLDGIRVIFKEHLMYDALDFCAELKKLGYQVFAQLVSVTTYTDDKFMELVEIVNNVEPYALSMVDTYGLLHQNNLMHMFKILDKHLKPSIALGYHAHNNFQMGYANCIAFLNSNVQRTILVDGTLYGMGKSAGNAPIELIAMFLNDNYGKHYDVGQMLEAIETNIIEIQKKVQWGYNLFYYVSASTKCHPNYVSYFMNKGTLSMKDINELLSNLEEDKKLMYDQKYAEEQYLKFQKAECDDKSDIQELGKALSGKELLVLGPGKTIKTEEDNIKNYIAQNHPVVLSINYIPELFKLDYMFLTNSKRYIQMNSKLTEPDNADIEVISTSNVVRTQGDFHYRLNYSHLIDEEADIPDNSLVMLLRACENYDIKKIVLAGFDGYSEKEMNYFNTNMEYSFVKDKAETLNHYVEEFLENYKGPKVEFLTTTHYGERK